MDEMRIGTIFMRTLIGKIIRKALKKKIGIDIELELKEVSISFDGGKARVHLNADAEMNKDELTKIIKKAGL